MKKSSEIIYDESFKNQHRVSEKFFTRSRKLSFALVIALILKKSVKSLQSMLNEIVDLLEVGTISNSALNLAQ